MINSNNPGSKLIENRRKEIIRAKIQGKLTDKKQLQRSKTPNVQH